MAERDLHEMITRYFDDALDHEDFDALCEAMRQDDALRRRFIRTSFTAQLMAENLNPHFAQERIQPPAAEPVITRRGASPWRIYTALAVAAAVVLVAGISWQWLSSGDADRSQNMSPASVALLTHTVNARWEEDSLSPKLGEALAVGPRRLSSGKAQILLASGAVVDMIGQCEFELVHDNRVRLHHGLLFADVPAEATGFTIEAPGGLNVIDLGTRFAVYVDETGADVRVSQGQVAIRTHESIYFCRTGQAMRVPRGVDRTEAVPADRLTRLLLPPLYTHLSFDSPPRIVRTDGSQTSMPTLDTPASYTAGPFGQALSLDGQHAVETSLPGVTGAAARTVAAWVRIPQQAEGDDAYSIVAWGDHSQAGGKWQVAWNQSDQTGVLGALRCEVEDGWIIGSTDLRDGRWHHIAVVFDGDNIEQAELYVDGQREAISNTRPQQVDTRTGSLVLGRYLNQSNRYFRGAIDEMYLVNDALTAQQIKMLMRDNRIPEHQLSTQGDEP